MHNHGIHVIWFDELEVTYRLYMWHLQGRPPQYNYVMVTLNDINDSLVLGNSDLKKENH
jgi:hypothetical protein